MKLTDELGTFLAGEGVYVPLVADPALSSDSPILADMLLEKGSPWPESGGFMMRRVSVRMADSGEAAPAALLPPLSPDRIIDPVTPPWIRMREDYQAGRLKLDTPGRGRPAIRVGDHDA